MSMTRHRQIVEQVRDEGAVSVRDLAEKLSVSESTIRRDLVFLDDEGALVRTRGGAVRRPLGKTLNLSVPELGNHEAVAEQAVELVRDGEVVLLDNGPVGAQIARRLRGHRVTVVTSDMTVIDELRDDDVAQLLVLGGSLRSDGQSLAGSLRELALGLVSADIAFLDDTGIRVNGHVIADADDVMAKRAMIEAAVRVVLLPPTKRNAWVRSQLLCHLADIDVLLADSETSSEVVRMCEDADTRTVRV